MSPASPEELDELLAMMQSQPEDLLERLGRNDGEALRYVIGCAEDLDPEVRIKASGLLGAWLGRQAETPETELDRAASEAVVRLMLGDRRAKVRWTAVLCSQGIRPSPLPHLLAATKDRSAGVRYYVAFALSCYTSAWFRGEREQYRPMVIEGLLRLIADKDEDVREWAALGLGIGGHKTPETCDRLSEMLDDRDPGVAGAAASSLVHFRDPGIRAGIVRLLEAEELTANVFDAARKLGDPTLLPLVRDASARFERMVEANPSWKPARWDLSAIEVLSARAGRAEG